MNASEALKAARAAGIEIGLDGDDLVLEASAAPPAILLDALSRHKAGVVILLRTTSDGWSAEDWQELFDERAGIAEFDDEQSRAEAEARAFECCVVEWMNRNPQPSDPDRCAWCDEREYADGRVIVPFGTDNRGHTWLHHRCWPPRHQYRQQRAVEALAALGITPTPASATCGETSPLENAENPNDFAKSGEG